MAREIIHMQVGQCGNQVGAKFWNTLFEEHKINLDGTTDEPNQNLNVFFRETSHNTYVPRNISVDLEPGVIDNLRNDPQSKIFNPANMISGISGAGNNWAKGFYTDGTTIIDDIINCIQKEAEATDCLQGFQMTHSLGGGTGSGLGSLILSKLREEYPDRILQTFSVFPSPKTSDVVIEPYNTTLSIHQLVEQTDAVNVVDNEALFQIQAKRLGVSKPTYHDLNKLVSLAMSGVTSSLRYPGLLNSDLRKLCVNLIPFPRLHFFLIGCAPLLSVNLKKYHYTNISEILEQLFDADNIMCACNPLSGKYLTASVTFRGSVSNKEIDNQMAAFQKKHSDQFVQWISNNTFTSVCKTDTPTNSDMPPIFSTFISNSTAIKEMFIRIHDQFKLMYNRKAYLHWYANEGMDMLELSEAGGNLSDLIAEYEQNEEVVLGDI